MFSERNTTHFFGVTRASEVSFSTDADGDVWVKCKRDGGKAELNLNMGKHPVANGCAMPTHKLNGVRIEIAETPTDGTEYIVDVPVKHYSDYSENPINMTAAAMAVAGDTVETLTAKLAKSIFLQAYAHEKHTHDKIINVYVGASSDTTYTSANMLTYDGTSIKVGSNDFDETTGYDYFAVVEAEQEWQWGVINQRFLAIDAVDVRFFGKETNSNPSDINWGTAVDVEGAEVKMTKTLADMEYQHIMNRMDGMFGIRREFMGRMKDVCVMDELVNSNTQCNVIRISGTYRGDDGHDVQESKFELILAGNQTIVNTDESTDGIAKDFVTATSSTQYSQDGVVEA